MFAPNVNLARARRTGVAVLAASGALALLGLGDAANAQSGTVTFDLAFTGSANVNTFQFSPTLNGSGLVERSVYSTAYATSLNVSGSVTSLNTYCVDFANSLSGPRPYSYNVSLLPTSSYNLGLSQTLNFNSATVSRGDALAFLYATHAGGADAVKSSALQIALWKTAYDWDGTANSLNLANGNFRFAGNAEAQVLVQTQSILTSLNNWDGQAIDGVSFYSTAGAAGAQALIGGSGGSTGGQGSPIPEPGTLALLAPALLGGIGVAARRRKRA